METIGAVVIALVFLGIMPIPVVAVLYYYFRKMAPVREAAALKGTSRDATTQEAAAH